MKPLCFVLMPFGVKTDGNKEIDFDKVYNKFIKPAIEEAGLEPLRADEEKTGGFIHKPMYERLMFCDFAVADLSFANANVFYELGIRHALKPHTTVSIYDTGTRIPFDAAPLRTFPYQFEAGEVKNTDTQIKALAASIKTQVQRAQHDSPIGQLITGYKFPDLSHLQQHADSFSNSIQVSNSLKKQILDHAKKWKQLESLKKTSSETEKRNIEDQQTQLVGATVELQQQEAGTLKHNFDLVYALLDAYKMMNAFRQVRDLLQPLVETTAGDHEPSYKNDIYTQQQLALAYNKTKARDEAKDILEKLVEQYGPDPETCGLLGAVYKGLMDDNGNDPDMKQLYCQMAIDNYLTGFESDPRDYYPGINALTLSFLSENFDEGVFNKYYPLVSYAVERQIKQKSKDYWLQATALELTVLKEDVTGAKKNLATALACNPDKYMKESTGNNLLKIYNKLEARGGDNKWLSEIFEKLK